MYQCPDKTSTTEYTCISVQIKPAQQNIHELVPRSNLFFLNKQKKWYNRISMYQCPNKTSTTKYTCISVQIKPSTKYTCVRVKIKPAQQNIYIYIYMYRSPFYFNFKNNYSKMAQQNTCISAQIKLALQNVYTCIGVHFFFNF